MVRGLIDFEFEYLIGRGLKIVKVAFSINFQPTRFCSFRSVIGITKLRFVFQNGFKFILLLIFSLCQAFNLLFILLIILPM